MIYDTLHARGQILGSVTDAHSALTVDTLPPFASMKMHEVDYVGRFFQRGSGNLKLSMVGPFLSTPHCIFIDTLDRSMTMNTYQDGLIRYDMKCRLLDCTLLAVAGQGVLSKQSINTVQPPLPFDNLCLTTLMSDMNEYSFNWYEISFESCQRLLRGFD
jgi:hypothetical protein